MFNLVIISFLMAQPDAEKLSVTQSSEPTDTSETASIKSEPIPRSNPLRWASPNDYPVTALRKGLQGTSFYKLTVNAKGKVENCVITKSSGHSILDNTTCKITKKRARFIPAMDDMGNATTGTYSYKVDWSLPD